MQGINVTRLIQSVRTWLGFYTRETRPFSYFYTMPNVTNDLGSLVNAMGAVTRDILENKTPSVVWPRLMAEITEAMEEILLQYYRPNGREFRAKIYIPYNIRRNLLEDNTKFQQPGFGFVLAFENEKDTMWALMKWSELNNLTIPIEDYLILFIIYYLALNAHYRDTHDNLFFSDFNFVLTLEQRIAARLPDNPIYVRGSWIWHPLTSEEDDEYQIELGNALILTQEASLRKKALEIEENNIHRKFLILNATIKKIIIEVRDTITQIRNIEKQFSTLFANDFLSRWSIVLEKKRILQQQIDDVIIQLIELKLYDVNTNAFIASIPTDTDYASIQNAKLLFIESDLLKKQGIQ